MISLPWTAELPSSWNIVPARAMLKSVRREPRSMDMTVTAFRDGQVTLRSNRRIDGFTESVKDIGYQGVRQGEVVIHSMDAFAGAIGVSDSDGKMSPVVHIYTAPSDSPEFLVYSLRVASRAGFIRALAKGIRERSTSFDRPVLKTMLLPRPPRKDQDAIVEYLDRETQKIDELIDEQRGLIETLRERRIAIIRALVSGVEQGGSTRPSEEWFGLLPKGWKIAPVIYDFDVTLGKMLNSSKGKTDGSVEAPYLAAGSIQPDFLDLNHEKSMSFTHGELQRYSLYRGDVVVVEGGAGYGRSHCLTEDLPGWGFQNHVARVREVTGRVTGRFLNYCLKACLSSGYVEANNRTSTMPSLSRDVLGAIRIPLPPTNLQHSIVDKLDEQTSRIDELIGESEELIALSQERRAALITAAVTGQIDVGTAV